MPVLYTNIVRHCISRDRGDNSWYHHREGVAPSSKLVAVYSPSEFAALASFTLRAHESEAVDVYYDRCYVVLIRKATSHPENTSQAQRIEVFQGKAATGTEEYFAEAIAAGYYGCDDGQQFAYKTV